MNQKTDDRGLLPQLKEGDEIDGGIVDVAGKKMRIILDHRGIYKEHREIDGPALAAGSGGSGAMEAATARALAGPKPAGLTMKPAKAKPKGKAGEGDQAGDPGEGDQGDPGEGDQGGEGGAGDMGGGGFKHGT